MIQNTELIRQAQSGDVHAFALLYEQIYRDLYRFALYTLRHEQDAEDAVSEAVTDAFAQIGSLREAGAFSAWMFRILSKKCARRIRSYRDFQEELDESIPAPQKDLEEQMDTRSAFESLPPQDRLILSLNLFAGYSSQEISDTLGMNPNTVRSRQSRALKKMQQMLGGQCDESR
ncbi:MAG: sigma-70 family RNA polymerase sigma factor [Lachnospiraceae bacterium]|nr:sigma-70 family RNA polymerase sigma factor [Lachnospiraceae bacterium]